MLNTIMALWNHNPAENRQRVVKVFLTFFLISVSVFLFLFTLNSSTWPLSVGVEHPQAKNGKLLPKSYHKGIATAGNTPASNPVVAKITPTATVSSTHTIVQLCVPTATVVKQQSATVTPQKAITYYGNNGLGNSDLENKNSIQHVHVKVVRVRRSRQHLRKKLEAKAKATPLPHAKETINITLPISPIPVTATVQPAITPTATVSVTATSVPGEGTVVSNVSDIVVMDATPEVQVVPASTFAHSLQRRTSMRIPLSPLVESHAKEDRGKKGDHQASEAVACSGVALHKESSGETLLHVKRHLGVLLGGALLGALMLCSFMFVRRED